MKYERRHFPIALRAKQPAAEEQEQQRTVSGYAATFNTLSEDLGGWQEMIAPGAFDGCLNDDVRCLYNHDWSQLLGRKSSGTLRLSVDDRGLAFECDLPDTDCAEDVACLMERGDLNECSFQFAVADQTWDKRDGVDVRVITRFARLYDVSIVALPAYPGTETNLRSAMEVLADRPTSGAAAPPARNGAEAIEPLRLRLGLALQDF